MEFFILHNKQSDIQDNSSKIKNKNLIIHINLLEPFEEYEKTVIFRLGRILTGGARGPGVFFIIPCVDIYEVIDMRVQNFSVPPQEVKSSFFFLKSVI